MQQQLLPLSPVLRGRGVGGGGVGPCQALPTHLSPSHLESAKRPSFVDDCCACAARVPLRWSFPLAALLVALLGFFWGERVEVNGGLGWDGVIYARWARD